MWWYNIPEDRILQAPETTEDGLYLGMCSMPITNMVFGEKFGAMCQMTDSCPALCFFFFLLYKEKHPDITKHSKYVALYYIQVL
jgi:hypothetical protein